MGSAFGAGAGADMLQEVLKRKMLEQYQNAQIQNSQARLAEDTRQNTLQNTIAQGQLGLGNRREDESIRQFNEQAPVRMATARHLGASSDALDRAPAEADKGRTFTAGQNEAQRTFQGGQGDLNRGNAVRIAGMNGANALAVANVRHPEPAGPTAQQQNEVQDSIALIDQIAADPSLRNAVGPFDQYAGGVINADLTGVNRFRALHNQLTGKLSLAQAGKLKGQGQISDKERAMLASAATALNQGLSEGDYKAELQKVRGQFERMAGGGPQLVVQHGSQPGVAAGAMGDFRKKYGY